MDQNTVTKDDLTDDEPDITKDESTLTEYLPVSSNVSSVVKEEFVHCRSLYDSSDTHTVIKEEIFVEEPHQEQFLLEVFFTKTLLALVTSQKNHISCDFF